MLSVGVVAQTLVLLGPCAPSLPTAPAYRHPIDEVTRRRRNRFTMLVVGFAPLAQVPLISGPVWYLSSRPDMDLDYFLPEDSGVAGAILLLSLFAYLIAGLDALTQSLVWYPVLLSAIAAPVSARGHNRRRHRAPRPGESRQRRGLDTIARSQHDVRFGDPMSTDILTRKLEKSFSQMDTDGNGAIDESDLLALGAKAAAEFGFEPESPRATAIAENLSRLWAELAEQVDLDRDGRITGAEYQQGMRSAFTSRATYDAFFRPAVDAILSLFDSDADGRISAAEWRRAQAGYGATAEQADEAFQLLDSNGSGYLTRAELSIATHEFYISEDANAQGNRLFGSLD